MEIGIYGSGNYYSNQMNPSASVSAPGKVGATESLSGIGSDINAAGKTAKTECQTCKSRTYVDRSDEGNVSFKSPTHISPESAGAAVLAHENQHVANAVNEGNKEANQLLSVSVSLQMSVCPECGRSYVSGGTTSTTIKYQEKNPYEANRKSLESSVLKGRNVDLVA